MIVYDRHGLPHDDPDEVRRRAAAIRSGGPYIPGLVPELEPPPDRSWVTTETIGKPPRPKYPSPARAPENACPVCWRRLPLLGIWPTCRRCPGHRVVFDRPSESR